MSMSSASPFGAVWSRPKQSKADRIKSLNLPPSVLAGPKLPWERGNQAPADFVRKPEYTADKEMKDIMREKEARERSARVEAGERAKGVRKDNSYAARATDGAKRSGSLADRGAVTKGRGYYHPDRIAERSDRRRERYERNRYG